MSVNIALKFQWIAEKTAKKSYWYIFAAPCRYSCENWKYESKTVFSRE